MLTAFLGISYLLTILGGEDTSYNMKILDYVILAALAIWFIYSLRRMIRSHRNGCHGCCGGGCNCNNCAEKCEKNNDAKEIRNKRI